MSHFFTIAIIPDDCADPKAEVARLLAPFDENLQVKAYKEECGCMRDEHREAKQRMLEGVLCSIDTMRDQHATLQKALNLKDNDWKEDSNPDDVKLSKELWTARINLREQFEAAINARVGDKRIADPECEDCKGTGQRKSKYNPKSKWDWYALGGRWNGTIRNAYRGEEKGFNFDEQFRQIGENVIRVSDYSDLLENPDTRDEVSSFAVVTPDGEWLEKGSMGWWGMVSSESERDDWIDCLIATFDKYRTGYVAVGLDLHI